MARQDVTPVNEGDDAKHRENEGEREAGLSGTLLANSNSKNISRIPMGPWGKGTPHSGSLTAAYKRGDISAYGNTVEERQISRDFWGKMLRDAVARDDERAATRASRMLHTFAEYDLKLAEAVDKATRLDAGESTENYTFGAVKFRGDRKLTDDKG